MKSDMTYEKNKADVLDLFDNHIIKYIIKDLEVLDRIKADASGVGGCAIPQASATFSALDLIGYLVHHQEPSELKMCFGSLLNNEAYFPSLRHYKNHRQFLELMRDDVRSVMAHRFYLARYDITKEDNGHLFYDGRGKIIFSTSHFTKLTIRTIYTIYECIKNDTLLISGFSKEASMEKIKDRVDKLKNYESDAYATLIGLQSFTVTTQTTISLE